MFEPLLRLLTRGYVAAGCEEWPILGTPWPAAGSAGEVMGLRSNPAVRPTADRHHCPVWR